MKLLAATPALVLVAAAAHLAGCAHNPPPILVSGADTGKSIEMIVGQTLTISLPSDPSTGYRWQVTAEPDARNLIVLVSGFDSTPSKAPAPSAAKPDTPRTSNAGRAWWKLRATGEGSTSFGLRYVRPWEPETNAQEFTIGVDVKPVEKSGKPAEKPAKGDGKPKRQGHRPTAER